MNNSLQSNIWKYAILLVTNKRMFVAILSAYYLTIPDVTVQSIGIIMLFGSLAGFFFEIPSGYFSDKMGHKQALVLSRVFVLFSTTFFLFANNLFLLILGSAFLAISHAFLSGTGSAFMHETLSGLGRDDEYTKIMGKVSSVGYAVPIILIMLVPFLVNISFKLPFVIGLIIDAVGLVVALSFVVPKVSQKQIEEINTKNFRQVIAEGLDLHFFRHAIFGAIMGGLLFSIGAFRAPYQILLGIPVIYFGVFHSIGRVGASLLLAYSGKLKQRLTIISFYRFEIVLFALLLLSLAFVSNPWIIVIVFLVINAFQWGLGQVRNGFILEIIKKNQFKATLLSTKSQLATLIGGMTSLGLGLIIENTSYQTAYLYLAIVFLAILIPLYLYIAKSTQTK